MTARSPVGPTAVEAARARAAGSLTYRTQQVERAAFAEIAWLVIKSRSEACLSQRELAERARTSQSQIARVESGRKGTSVDTLRLIAADLGKRLVLGFETTDASGRRRRDLVAL